MRHGLVTACLAAFVVAGCATGSGPPGASTRPGTPPTGTSAGTATGTTATTSTAPSGSTTRPSTRPRTSAPPHTSSAPVPPTTTASGLPAGLAGRDWERLATSRRVVALTFDAGGDDAGVSSILATLAREKVPGTFFLTGRWVQVYPGAARAIARAQRVGDHSVDHPHFTGLSDAAIRAEVLDAARTIRAVTGADPEPLFRFPYGDRDSRTIAAVNALGYVPVRWTVDTLGWQGTSGGRSTASVLARVLAGAVPGEIVLMHVGANPDDRSTLDADALPQIIHALRDRGFGFVSLDMLTTGI